MVSLSIGEIKTKRKRKGKTHIILDEKNRVLIQMA
jgi:hypothetical protein